MSFTFRKRVKVLPGIYLNLSRKGVSTTIGPRGANINIGKKGVYLNTGIPGTGFSNRQKLFGGDSNNPNNPVDVETTPLPTSNEPTDSTQDIVTSEGLKGLKENLDESKQERITLASEIKETTDKLSELETDLEKKQNGLFSKLFTKKETIENLQTEVDDTTKYLEDLKKQFEESKADINIQFDTDIEEQYQKLNEGFEQLRKCNKIWDIVTESESTETKSSAKFTVNRTDVSFKPDNIDFIKSEHPAFHLQNANGSQLFVYPAFILLMDKAGAISLVDLKELNFNFKLQRFIEPKESVPADTKIVDYAWAKVNKDGSPDMRFKGNYQTPVVHYGSLSFVSSNGLNETYYISNADVAQNFANEFASYLALLKDEPTPTPIKNSSDMPTITREYYETLKDFSDQFLLFISKLQNDKRFNDYLVSTGLKDTEQAINGGFTHDVLKWFNMVADLNNLKSKEAFSIIFLIGRKNELAILNEFSNLQLVYQPNILGIYENLRTNMRSQINNQETNSLLATVLSGYDKELRTEYLANLYRFVSIVVKADGTVSKEEEAALKKIMSIADEKKIPQAANEKQTEEKAKVAVQPKQQTLEEALEELNTLIGLNAVKQEINSLINFIKVQKARESTGLKSSSLSYHIVFTGNPGTGKTTVARIVSEIYKNLGVLAQGQLVETDRSGMVAEYVGQTAVKVNKTVDTALNGILFIDEAYSLVGESQDSFGKEAVSTLIKRMEDDRDKLVVILAGYTNEMNEFIETNPGFKSRFNRYIEFTDYQPDELLAIFKLQCKKLEYTLTADAEKKLSELLSTAFTSRDKSFGNGRYVRNTFEKTLEKQANRIASVPSLTKEILTTITVDDIPTK